MKRLIRFRFLAPLTLALYALAPKVAVIAARTPKRWGLPHS